MASKCEQILDLLAKGPLTVKEINAQLSCVDASARCAELFKRGKIIDVEPTRNRRVWGLATDANKCHAEVQQGMQEVMRSQEADLMNGDPGELRPGEKLPDVVFAGLRGSLERGTRPKEWHLVVRDSGPFGEMATGYRIKKLARQAAINVKGRVITTREV